METEKGDAERKLRDEQSGRETDKQDFEVCLPGRVWSQDQLRETKAEVAQVRQQMETEKSEVEGKLQEEKDARAADKKEFEVCLPSTRLI